MNVTHDTESPQNQPSTGWMLDGWDVDLATLGRDPHLIQDVLELRSTAWLVGPSGSYKSFTALSMAVCVATGQPWHGRPTHPGSVVYVCSEGSKAWAKRMAAYTQTHTLPDQRHAFRMVPAPVQIGSPTWVAFVATLEQIKPALVVIDTQAQCATNYEENSNSVSRFPLLPRGPEEDLPTPKGVWAAWSCPKLPNCPRAAN